MESSVEIGFLRVTEKAAIAAARTMGYGKRKYSDQVAVESMREELGRLKMRGTVVIGEGERDKAPMLYVGEPLGRGWTEGEIYPEVDIAVDPLEGTNLCATGSANAIAVLAATRRPGIDVVLEFTGLADRLAGADLVITGGTIVDGTGAPGRPGTVIVEREEVIMVEPALESKQ